MDFPILFWNYSSIESFDDPEALVQEWRGAGMTWAMSPNVDGSAAQVRAAEALLDAAAAAGMRIVVRDRRAEWHVLTNEGETAYRQGLSAATRELGGHPALFGFHVGDEPDAAANADARRAMSIALELAPEKTPFLNLLPWYEGVLDRVGASSFEQYLDDYVREGRVKLLSYDCYAQMNPGHEGWPMYFENLRRYSEAARRNGIPYWTTLLSTGHFRYRPPSEDDLRWQLSTAVAHGAKGILYFHWNTGTNDNYRLGPVDEFGEHTPTYDSLKRVNRRFTHKVGSTIADLALRSAEHVGEAFGGFPLFTGEGRAVEAISHAGTPLIVSEFKHPSGADYIAVTNNSCWESTRAELWVRGKRPLLENVAWEGQHVPADGDGWTQEREEEKAGVAPWLAPGQMELYRVVDEVGAADA
jgi:hypothetical protein